MTSQSDENTSGDNAPTESPKVQEYKRKLASALLEGGNGASRSMGQKILHFKEQAPEPKVSHQNNLRVLYSQNKAQAAQTQSKKFFRHIATQPEKILDAPDFVDDYYLNLMAWGSNNKLAIALDTAVYLWSATSGEIECLLESSDPDNTVTSVSWAKEGSFLAVGFENADVQLWDCERQKLLRTMKGHQSRVSVMDWNKHMLSTGSRDTTIINHDVRIAQHQLSTFSGHSQEVCGLKWSDDGTQLASGANDNLAMIWDLSAVTASSATPKLVLDQHQAAVKALAWCPWQQNLLASGGGSSDRTIRFWNTTNGVCLNSIDTYSQVTALAWSKHEKEIVSSHGYSQNQLSIWKYPTMVKVADLTGHQSRILSMAQSPDGTTIASISGDETLRLWNCLGPNEVKAVAAKKAAASSSNFLSSVSLR